MGSGAELVGPWVGANLGSEGRAGQASGRWRTQRAALTGSSPAPRLFARRQGAALSRCLAPLGDAAHPSCSGAELLMGCWGPPDCSRTPWAPLHSLQARGEEEEGAAGMQQSLGTRLVRRRTGKSCRERARGKGATGVRLQGQFQAIWGLQNHAGCPDNQYLPSF